MHRGAGYKSQASAFAYEDARSAALAFAGRAPGGSGDDTAIICRNTTEALNHLAYRLRLAASDVVVTTVAGHHANLLPWSRAATCRYVECGADGTFGVEDVEAALDQRPSPRLLAITGASNITGWMPPLAEIITAAHGRGIPVAVDAAQLAPHRPLPADADFLAWSGHKMYAPFGAGILLGPRRAFADGDPFLAGGGAVDLVNLNEVLWAAPTEREEAGSPNVTGAVALHAAIDTLTAIGWPALISHERGIAAALRHGCFCAHPYLMRLLGHTREDVHRYRDQVRHGDRSAMPGAIRASAGINTTGQDATRLLAAVTRIASSPRRSTTARTRAPVTTTAAATSPDSRRNPGYTRRPACPASHAGRIVGYPHPYLPSGAARG